MAIPAWLVGLVLYGLGVAAGLATAKVKAAGR